MPSTNTHLKDKNTVFKENGGGFHKDLFDLTEVKSPQAPSIDSNEKSVVPEG